ncbi:MAG: class I SAM-dependent methyltransferase [Gammaproteobacteria bacterium]|nr:class I SAM-dependent methyltransferase [Gammaproteobacteria bacterium]
MAKTQAFDAYTKDYDDWFSRHLYAYESELNAIRALLQDKGFGVEVGIGTGRFSAPLGIAVGIEPSTVMARMASAKGITVIEGVAEFLPLGDNTCDYLLYVTTLCFLDSIDQALHEAHRTLRPTGSIIIGLIDRDSALGEHYESNKSGSRFYQQATLYSANTVVTKLEQAGFGEFSLVQTLFTHPDKMKKPDPVKPGSGQGAFVVIRAKKIKI